VEWMFGCASGATALDMQANYLTEFEEFLSKPHEGYVCIDKSSPERKIKKPRPCFKNFITELITHRETKTLTDFQSERSKFLKRGHKD